MNKMYPYLHRRYLCKPDALVTTMIRTSLICTALSILFCFSITSAYADITKSPNNYQFIYPYNHSDYTDYTLVNRSVINIDYSEEEPIPSLCPDAIVNSASDYSSFPINISLSGFEQGEYQFSLWLDGKQIANQETRSWKTDPITFNTSEMSYGMHELFIEVTQDDTLSIIDNTHGILVLEPDTVFRNTFGDEILILHSLPEDYVFGGIALFVEGFDISFGTQTSFMTSLANDWFNHGLNDCNIALLKLKDPLRDARDNSMSVLAATRFIYQHYSCNEQRITEGVRLFGFSMGGVLSRYALAFAEDNSIEHYCVQYVSLDAPHRGAAVNQGLQNMVRSLDRFLSDNVFFTGGTTVRHMVRKVYNKLKSVAAKQLLRKNVCSTPEDCTYVQGSNQYLDLFSEINEEERSVHLPNLPVLNRDLTYVNQKPGFPYKQNRIRSMSYANGSLVRSGGGVPDSTFANYVGHILCDKSSYNAGHQEYDKQPGSVLPEYLPKHNCSGFLNSYNFVFSQSYAPVVVPTKSSLYLKTTSVDGNNIDDPQFAISDYNDISTGQGLPIDQYLSKFTHFDKIFHAPDPVNARRTSGETTLEGREWNWIHGRSLEHNLSSATQWSKDIKNRATTIISGTMNAPDLSDISIKAYLEDSGIELPLGPEFNHVKGDGTWEVPFTLLTTAEVRIVFSKYNYIPTVMNVWVYYDHWTGTASQPSSMTLTMNQLDYQSITVAQSGEGSFSTINYAIDYVADLASSDEYNGGAVRVEVSPGTYQESVDLSPLVATDITNFTLEGVGEAIIKARGYGIKLVVDEESTRSGAVYNIKNIQITADNVPGSSAPRNIRGIIYKDQFNNSAGDPPDPRITLNIQNCKIYDCCSYRSSETINPVPSAAAIHFEGAGTISDCEIYDNWIRGSDETDSERFQAGGLYVNSNTSSLVEIKGNTFENNEGGLAGGVVAKGEGSILIQNNKFFDNDEGGWCVINGAKDANALSVYEASDIVIRNNIFVDNISSKSPYGSSVSLTTYVSKAASPIRFINNTIINTPPHPNTSFSAITFMIYAGTSVQDIHIKNNVVSATNNNGCMINKSTGHQPLSLRHNVFHNISPCNYTVHLYNPNDPTSVCCPDSVNFNYSCDPELDATTYVPIWDETTMSHCIDNGEGELADYDPDGTPPDIGAYRAINHRYWEYQFRAGQDSGQPHLRGETYHWVSYPVVNSRTQGKRVAHSFFHELLGKHRNDDDVVVADVLDEIIWYEGNDGHKIKLIDDSWGPHVDNHNVVSHQGYKIRLRPLGEQIPVSYPPVVLHHSGFRTPATTPFMIYGSGYHHINEYQNWVGYFGTESVWPGDAFESIWDDLTMVKAKDWCLYRDPVSNTNTLKGVMRPINPGDMVVVSTICDHQFSWNTSNYTDPIVKEKPIAFIYDEKADYTPVYIDLSDVDTANLREIGLKHDGVCKGAVVVTDSLEQICAYLEDDESLSSGTVELEFFYESGKSALQERKCIAINREQMSSSAIGGNPAYPVYHIKLTDKDLGDKVVPVLALEQNYPNPFNPTTTIRYSLDEQGMMSLDIYNIKGQLVKNLYHGNAEAGSHSVIWNGLDNSGNSCASGVYFYKLRTSKTSLVRKMLLMK